MAEVSSAAYLDLRDYIQATWKYIELQDASGTAILRLSPSDARVTWTHTTGANPLELTIVVKGSDSDLSGVLPKTFAKSVIFKVASAGSALSTETYTSFTMATTLDELTVKHQIQVPQIV